MGKESTSNITEEYPKGNKLRESIIHAAKNKVIIIS